MPSSSLNSFGAHATLKSGSKNYSFYSLGKVLDSKRLNSFPFALKIFLENLLRFEDGYHITDQMIQKVFDWEPGTNDEFDISFFPSRILMQDFTGVPAICDLAALKDNLAKREIALSEADPKVPADLVIDHSVIAQFAKRPDALRLNAQMEFEENRERYEILKWAQNNLGNVRVVPPDSGICHQVNLEYISTVVTAKDQELYPDTLVGLDSHTTMVNSLGVLGWGVGGIEAEAVMLGLPISLLLPRFVGLKLSGKLKPGVTATDLVLVITQLLRNHGVVGKIVEFYGDGAASLAIETRATVSNMAPEYGATAGIFPIDEKTLEYLTLTGRSEEHVELVERYYREQSCFGGVGSTYDEELELDLSTVVPSVAGPKRPQDRIVLSELKATLEKEIPSGNSLGSDSIKDGSVVIAAITSCTNTSNPDVLIAAGLLAKKAVERGLTVPNFVKTSLAPGSKVVTEYLREAGLLEPLSKLGFDLVGYGCTTCIGNSGPLLDNQSEIIKGKGLKVAAVLSGNRNFESRIHPDVALNFLASPPLVVAFAIAGTVLIDLSSDPLGEDGNGKVFLKDIWPTDEEVQQVRSNVVKSNLYTNVYSHITDGDESWKTLQIQQQELFSWRESSTYIKRPPFFEMARTEPIKDIKGAQILVILGDSVTTDHISPAGQIPVDSEAGQYLLSQGVKPENFNSYGTRRGNHEVMVRGTLANRRLSNKLAGGKLGGYTTVYPEGEVVSIFQASERYRSRGKSLVIFAGAEYGTGSSRDWAAKGVKLLGVDAVIAESYERIHRSNLVQMGVLPLQLIGNKVSELDLVGSETVDILGLDLIGQETIPNEVDIIVGPYELKAKVRIDTDAELRYFNAGGSLPYILSEIIASKN